MYASANDTSQPSTQQASSIQSTHGKCNPSRALVDGFYVLSTTIVAFRNCFLLNLSDVETSESQSFSFASLSSSYGHMQCNAPQTMRAWCVVGGGVLVVGFLCLSSDPYHSDDHATYFDSWLLQIVIMLQCDSKLGAWIFFCLALMYDFLYLMPSNGIRWMFRWSSDEHVKLIRCYLFTGVATILPMTDIVLSFYGWYLVGPLDRFLVTIMFDWYCLMPSHGIRWFHGRNPGLSYDFWHHPWQVWVVFR